MQCMRGEVVLNIPAQKAWGMHRDDNIISKINPDMLAGAEYIQGDGSPGSLRRFRLGPAVQGYVRESTEKIENVDDAKHSVTYTVIGGELSHMYHPYRVTFSFNPHHHQTPHDPIKCLAEWMVEFEPVSPATPPPHKARDAALAFLKCFDNFTPN
ncbi:hypothetical protein Sjap_000233 [Stephania japonica]|uniref:Bet v I/Major latex protein domain-containing protein n=1 Tax=Stephania japonica TaxID=461633 RepID=A0AAP0PQ76_9MAGN